MPDSLRGAEQVRFGSCTVCCTSSAGSVNSVASATDSAVLTELVSRGVMRYHGWTMIGIRGVQRVLFNLVVGLSENGP